MPPGHKARVISVKFPIALDELFLRRWNLLSHLTNRHVGPNQITYLNVMLTRADRIDESIGRTCRLIGRAHAQSKTACKKRTFNYETTPAETRTGGGLSTSLARAVAAMARRLGKKNSILEKSWHRLKSSTEKEKGKSWLSYTAPKKGNSDTKQTSNKCKMIISFEK